MERDDLARAVFLGRDHPVMTALAFDVSGQVLFSGVMLGLAYGVLAVGVILVYRSRRVINFAIGEMGALGRRPPRPPRRQLGRALTASRSPSCVIVGGLLGAALELGVVRRLFEAPRVILFVATIGGGPAPAVRPSSSSPTSPQYTAYPTPITDRSWHVGDVIVRGDRRSWRSS